MRSQDNKVLASMLTSMEQRLLSEITETKEQIGAVKTDVVEIRTFQKAARDTHEAFRNELLGEGGRVFELERRQKSQDFWHNVKFGVMVPVMITLHKIASAIGLKL